MSRRGQQYLPARSNANDDPFDSPVTPTHLDWDPSSLYQDDLSSASSHLVGTNSNHRHSMSSPSPPPSRDREPSLDHSSQGHSRSMTQMTRDPVSRPPPSAFPFPFQSHPGNPDPGTRIPGVPRLQTSTRSSRRSSIDSLVDSDRDQDVALARPRAPFMEKDRRDSSGSLSSNLSSGSSSVYRASAAAASNQNLQNGEKVISRQASTNFRAPFLAPSSRPTSSLWAPPTPIFPGSPTASTTALAMPSSKPPSKSTRLAGKLTKQDKPWLMARPDGRTRGSWWVTLVCLLLGLAVAAIVCWRQVASTQLIPNNQLCPVLDDDFSSFDTDNTWNYDIELGGFGNGEFQMTTDDQRNVYINNNQLYIMPTLTSDDVFNGDTGQIFNGGSYTLPDCTALKTNKSACSVSSSSAKGTVINPVRSARINTQGKATIAFGKVEVRAKLPKGDWLWPAIWMLPDNDATYGPWPIGGEMDIMEARGNSPEYPAQGYNYVRSSINYGPMDSLVRTVTGWWSQKRSNYADDFHTYTLEWDRSFMRFYVDSRLEAMLDVQVGSGWWDRAGFPSIAPNGTAQVVVENPYTPKGGSYDAPFDQPFYLVINLAVGGTSGWFPDNVGGKPWFDGSLTAMSDFANHQSDWFSTWPTNADERAFRIDSVKMWKLC